MCTSMRRGALAHPPHTHTHTPVFHLDKLVCEVGLRGWFGPGSRTSSGRCEESTCATTCSFEREREERDTCVHARQSPEELEEEHPRTGKCVFGTRLLCRFSSQFSKRKNRFFFSMIGSGHSASLPPFQRVHLRCAVCVCACVSVHNGPLLSFLSDGCSSVRLAASPVPPAADDRRACFVAATPGEAHPFFHHLMPRPEVALASL
jgi:hypothetical protein